MTGGIGLGVCLVTAKPCWKLHKFALGTSLASLLFVLVLVGEDSEGLLWVGLPVLALGMALVANALWVRNRLNALPAALEGEERTQILERLGRRLWFPLMGMVGGATALLVLGVLGL